MFPIKEIEGIKNLSLILNVPLFSAACMTARRGQVLFQEPIIDWWVCLLIVVFVIGVISFVFDMIIVRLSQKDVGYFLSVWIGYIFLTLGLFLLPVLFISGSKGNIPPFYIFLTFGCLSQGFGIFALIRSDKKD